MYTQQYITTITKEKTQRQHLFLYAGVILNITSEMSLFLNTYVLSIKFVKLLDMFINMKILLLTLLALTTVSN